METRKEMVQKYKEMKTPMGVFVIRNKANGRAFIGASTDTKNILNRYRFELKMGSHRMKEMQKDWAEYGEEAFTFEVLEELKYDENVENKDYSVDLEIMKMIWTEKISNDKSIVFY